MKIKISNSLILCHTKVSNLYFYKCTHFLLFLSLSTFFLHHFHAYKKILTLISLIPIPNLPHSHHYSSHFHPDSAHFSPLFPALPHWFPAFPLFPPWSPCIAILIHRILIIPIIPFPASLFRIFFRPLHDALFACNYKSSANW